MPSPPRVRRGTRETNNRTPQMRPPPAIRRNQEGWEEIFPPSAHSHKGPPGGSPGGHTRRNRRNSRGGRRKSRKIHRTRRSRRHRGGAMYPNDDNTVIVDREDDSPDSVMRTRSYNSETDNPFASQNSSV